MVTSKIRIYNVNISRVLYGNKLSYTFISNWVDRKNIGPFRFYLYLVISILNLYQFNLSKLIINLF